MQDVIYIFQIMLLEFAWQVMHELPISSHIMLNIQFAFTDRCTVVDVRRLVTNTYR